ncbi:MAG: Ribonuclease [Gammaproteobacteria bacterium]|nr:Ribonuclease [Gammaproteobacteria bacterium]
MALEPVWQQKMAEKSSIADVQKAESALASSLNFKLPKSCFFESKEYRDLLKQQKKLHSTHFVLVYQNKTGPENKLGYVVSKKNIPLAVKRNRCRRIITASKSELHQCLETFWKKLATL